MKCGGDVSIGDLNSLKPSPSQQHLYLHLFRPRIDLLRETNKQLQLVFFNPDGGEEISGTWDLPHKQ